MYVRKESSAVSFGKLSDPYTVENSPLSASKSRINVFNTANFQAIVDETAQMYGYGKGQIRACVEKKDRRVFLSRDTSGSYSLQLQFTMNANIAPYRRITQYGQHFMYEAAKDYGKEIIFGIVGHEIGHLVAEYSVNEIETSAANGRPAIMFKKTLHPYWDELMADFLAGVTMAKAIPKISSEPMKNFLRNTIEGPSHPAGIWRVKAIEMGERWVRSKSPMLSDCILMNQDALKNELIKYAENFFETVYRISEFRYKYHVLPREIYVADRSVLKYL